MAKIITASEAEIQMIPDVEGTSTWVPTPHRVVIDNANRTADMFGVEPIRKKYELSKDGHKLFATWTLPEQATTTGREMQIGFRNSTNKAFAIGLVAGMNVMVCSNEMIAADWKQFRRHTAGIADPYILQDFIQQAFRQAIDEAGQFSSWFDELNTLAMQPHDHKIFVYDLMAHGALPPSKFEAYRNCLKEELKDNRTPAQIAVSHSHGAVTRALRGASINTVQERTSVLNKVTNTWIATNRFEKLAEF